MKADYRNRYRLLAVCIGLILIAGCANQANNSSQTANLPDRARANLVNLPQRIIEDSKNSLEKVSETSNSILESTRTDIVNLMDRIVEDTKDTFSERDNIIALLLAGGASVALHSSDADKKIAESFDDKRIFHGFTDESLNVIGHPWTHIGASAVWYTLSSQNHDELNKQRAKTMIAALSVTGAVTMGFKAIRQNESPNGKNWAWPSGHTASCFTAASVLDEFYGPKVGIPAYALASLVAYRMMDSGDHWTSDVVFGATLGWVVGHTFAGKHKQLEIAGFHVIPNVNTSHGPVMGLSLAKRF